MKRNELQDIRDLLERTLISTRDSASPSLSKVILEFQNEFKLFKQEVFSELKRVGEIVDNNQSRLYEVEKWKSKRIIEIAQAKGGIQFTHKFILAIAAIFGSIAGIVSWSFDIITHLHK